MPDTLTQIEVVTRRFIDTDPDLKDLVFNRDPLMSFNEANCLQEIDAGSSWNDNVEYDVQDGGSYSKGQDLPADQRQIEQQLRFNPSYQTVLITFFKEDIKVLNANGPERVVDFATERTQSAMMQLGAQTAIQSWLEGYNAQYVRCVNGLTEAISDGTNVGWLNTTYPVYGTLTRSIYGGRMISPTPYNFAGANISVPQMESMYQSVNYGSGPYEPNIIMTTPIGQGNIRNNFQTQQLFQDVKTANGGFRGLAYNGAVILASRYCPGSYLMNAAPAGGPFSGPGTNDRVAVRYLTYSGINNGVYPTPSTMTNTINSATVYGETIWFLNARKPHIKYRISKNPPYNGSLDDDGFIPSAGSTRIVGKVLLAHNYSILPGYHTYGFNFVG